MAKKIFVQEFQPPSILQTDKIVIFPTDVDYYLSDYDAVMKSKRSLRIWGQSDWPEDNFTAAQNKEDLAYHVTDNRNHTAYGYMIYSLDRKFCYGSLYVNPLGPVPENYEVSQSDALALMEFDCRLDYWVLEGQNDLEEEITLLIQRWMREEWKVQALFCARFGSHERLLIYEKTGMRPKFNFKNSTLKTSLLLYQ